MFCILTDSTAPMSVVVASNLVPVPVVLVTVTVGKSVYATPPSCTNTFCIEPDSVVAERFSKVSNSRTIWSVTVLCVSGVSTTESVSMVCPASVEELSVPFSKRLSTVFPSTNIRTPRAGASVNVSVALDAVHIIEPSLLVAAVKILSK